jgi:curved DNA-binding protein CbpA
VLLVWDSVRPMGGKDPYELLGVPRDATDERIRAAYELEVNRATREGAFRYAAELATAYETISNPRRRALYERHGLTAIQERSPGSVPPPRSWRAAPSGPSRQGRRRTRRWMKPVLILLVAAALIALFAVLGAR